MNNWKKRRAEIPPFNPDSSVPWIIQDLLALRGYADAQEWEVFFAPKLSQLKSPWLLADMSLSVDRLEVAFRRQEPICLYADFDLDGTSALALALQAFRELGFKKLLSLQPQRLTDGYGFHPHLVEDVAAKGARLIVTMDVGITSHEAAQKARELAVDVIITDHHQPENVLPEALAVVNPNRRDCNSGLGYLCGAGVMFYLLRALKRRLVEKALVAENSLNLRSLLDLLTVATLTDMVPLIEDNRLLVKHGLQVLSETARPGLRALLEKLKLSGRILTGQDVAFRFAPKLNALSRLESGLRPLDLYMAETMEDAENIVDDVLDRNAERVELQARGEEIAMAIFSTQADCPCVFVTSTEFHRGVVGLIATKMANQTGRPAFVGAESADGVVVGSARAPQGKCVDVLRALKTAADFFTRFGGHGPAAGFEFRRENASAIALALASHFAGADEQSEMEIEYDLDLSLEFVTANLIQWINSLGPYGTQFPLPLFCFRELRVESVKILKGNHLKLGVVHKNLARTVTALYFSPPPDLNLAAGMTIDVLGELQKNDFRRVIEPQILIRDLR
ncbi:MAG: single-stranded-DNA-specific exonuclease RecJ [Bdellovibrio sp.]|nr:MAG: single-stranded-DNA-specific exonuclease RecJ [Bdellovibrio sp.]